MQYWISHNGSRKLNKVGKIAAPCMLYSEAPWTDGNPVVRPSNYEPSPKV